MKFQIIIYLTACIITLFQAIPSYGLTSITWGTNANDTPFGLVLDETGAAYILDDRSIIDLNDGLIERNSESTMFLSKYDTNGSLVWEICWHSTGRMGPSSMSIDNEGYIYIVGNLNGTMDMDPGPEADILSIPGVVAKGFLIRLNNDGCYLWGRSIDAWLRAVSCDNNGGVCLTGRWPTSEDVYLTGEGRNDPEPGNLSGLFLCKYDNGGNKQWCNLIGGNSFGPAVGGYEINIDADGNVYVRGIFNGCDDFDPGPDEHVVFPSNNETSSFLAKYNNDGEWIWVRSINLGSYAIVGPSFSIDNAGEIYFSDVFNEAIEFDTKAGLMQLEGLSDACNLYISKYNSNGDLEWVKEWQATEISSLICADDIVIDALGRIYITGSYSGTYDLNPGAGFDIITGTGYGSPFLVCLDNDGKYLWSKTWDDNEWAGAKYIAVSEAGIVYITGYFKGSIDLDPSESVDEHISNGKFDCFMIIL